MGNVDVRGYEEGEIIRLNLGSPTTTNVQFAGRTESVMIDNQDTVNDVFFNFTGSAMIIGSVSGIVPAGEVRIFDIKVGSIGLLPNALFASGVQVIGLKYNTG